MRLYHDFFLVPGSKSTFPDTDPDPDPGKWYGSGSETLSFVIYYCAGLKWNLFNEEIKKRYMKMEEKEAMEEKIKRRKRDKKGYEKRTKI